MTYGEIQKVQMNITSNTLTMFPNGWVQAVGVAINLTDIMGGLDWLYDNSNRLQQAGYPYITTNPIQNPYFMWRDKP